MDLHRVDPQPVGDHLHGVGRDQGVLPLDLLQDRHERAARMSVPLHQGVDVRIAACPVL